MYFLIYKTTNLINNKIYIGQHKTKDINDNYIGSGSYLWKSIRKYGIENFKREILFIFDNHDDMNSKEAELVDQKFLDRPDTMNLVLGGTWMKNHNKIVARYKGTCKKYFLLDRNDWEENRDLFELPASGKLVVRSSSGDRWCQIDSSEYNPEVHITPSTGYVSVYNIETGKPSRIKKTEYDSKIHKKVSGGKVIKDEFGVLRYSTSDDSENIDGIYKGLVTVLEKSTGIRKHVSCEEVNKNPELYEYNTKGRTFGKNKKTGEIVHFIKGSITDTIRSEYHFSTTGERTVYDIQKMEFCNIDKNLFDSEKHKLSSDKKIKFFTNEGVYDYWGSKKDFLKKFNAPEALWIACILNNKKFFTTGKKYSKYNGSYVVVEEWK
mgnify:CR=1 FL=1